jgi:hypothetical protein
MCVPSACAHMCGHTDMPICMHAGAGAGAGSGAGSGAGAGAGAGAGRGTVSLRARRNLQRI